MSKTLKIAVIGIGRIGEIHLKNLVLHCPGIKAVAVSPNPNGRDFAASLGVKEIYEHAGPVLEDKSVDAIALCSPTTTHAQYLRDFIRAGKQIFCEKPLDQSLKVIREVDQLANENDIKLMLAFQKRFDQDFSNLKKLVTEGKTGVPHILKITSRDPFPPPFEFARDSGGLFMDMVVHDFDMARFLIGSEVEEVYAKAQIRIDPQLESIGDYDTAVTTLTFENGVYAQIDNSRKTTYGYDQRVEVFGSEGMVGVDNQRMDRHYWFNEQGSHHARALNFFMDRYEDAYLREIQEFVRILREDLPVPTGAEDGYQATAIALAAGKSVQENRPVKISEITGYSS